MHLEGVFQEDINFTRVGKGVYEGPKGFSAFQFIPNTNDELIIALKSEEIVGRLKFMCIFCFRMGSQ